MGSKLGKLSKVKEMAVPEISEELLAIYVREEFKAMDSDSDGVLNKADAKKLLSILGVDDAMLEAKLTSIIADGQDTVDCETYATAVIADKELVDKTSKFRTVFSLVDKNKDGYATKDELQGAINTVASKFDKTLGDKIGKLDADGDGKVSYSEYLACQMNIQSKIPGQ